MSVVAGSPAVLASRYVAMVEAALEHMRELLPEDELAFVRLELVDLTIFILEERARNRRAPPADTGA